MNMMNTSTAQSQSRTTSATRDRVSETTTLASDTRRMLDVGCGRNKTAGAVGVDRNLNTQADVIADLWRLPLPFRDKSFGAFVCKQVLEHFERPLEILDELYRLAQPGAVVVIEVPHFSCHYAFRSLHHRTFWSYFSLDTYVATTGRYAYVTRHITFHKAFRRWGVQTLANHFPLAYERFWTFICPAEHLHIELRVVGQEAEDMRAWS